MNRRRFLLTSLAGPLAVPEAAAQVLGVELAPVGARHAGEVDAALEAVAHRKRIVDFVLRKRIPAMSPEREFADVTGLVAYGPNVPANFRRAAVFVDKILKGAKPADLPVEEPTTFEFVSRSRRHCFCERIR